MRDPYSVLGVKRDAGAEEIKAAWRTIAKAVHPDQNQDDPTATTRFAEIGQAYDVLKDPNKRSRYDQERRMADSRKRERTILQQREAARQAAEQAKAAKANAERVMEELARANAERAATAAAAGAKTGGASVGGTAAESAEDMVSRIFGTPGAATASPSPAGAGATADRGAEARTTTPETSTTDTGKTAAVPLPLQAVDLLTSLVRRIRGVQPALEKAPDIMVETRVSIEDLLKQAVVTVPLPEGREVRFALEAGTTDGKVVRLKAQGLKLQGLQRGDVAVTVRVDHNDAFWVQGADIHTILPVPLENAVLGGEMMADSPTGPTMVTVPAWSGSDQVIRVAGKGLPAADGARGDLVVEIRLMLWEKPDDKVTDLMRSMRQGLFL